MVASAETLLLEGDWSDIDFSSVTEPIAGEPAGKNLLSMYQLDTTDVHDYIGEATAATMIIDDPMRGGVDLLSFAGLAAVMRQPSTRTGGSMTRAMRKLGGSAELISGMASSSEAKGESLADSWLAFATQAEVIGTRTKEEYGPAYAAYVIAQSVEWNKLPRPVPVINLGDGINEHPTQALGDLFTINKQFTGLEDVTLAIVGDHERYRSHHSLMIGAATMGMKVIAVESPVAPVPNHLTELLGDRLARTNDLDEAMRQSDVLYMGRNPDEYTGKDLVEAARQAQLIKDFGDWMVDRARLQIMSQDAIVMHPRPRLRELDSSVDSDPRMVDVAQMAHMIPMRMAIIARHMGVSIIEHV